MKTIIIIMTIVIMGMVFPAYSLSQEKNTQWISEPEWGFKFKAPKGWVSQTDNSSAILINEDISGIILIFPHKASSLEDVQKDMQLGLEEEDIQLSLSGKLKIVGKDKIIGDYTGYYNLEMVKGRGIGILSPLDGGAYIISFTSKDKYNRKVSEVTDEIIKSIQFSKPTVTSGERGKSSGTGSNDLMSYFTGTYFSYTGGGVTSGGTERRFVICTNGQFYFTSESSYSAGAGTENAWGAASQSGEAGTWDISGDKNSGEIMLTYTNGNTEVVNYRVCGDGCINFNQIQYAYEKTAECE